MKKISLLTILLLHLLTLNMAYCDMKPAILFCSPRESEYKWIDLSYLTELNQKGFEVDHTDSILDMTWERISKYNVLALYSTPHDETFSTLIDKYLSEGGGVILFAYEHNIGKQFMSDIFEHWGAKIPVERIVEQDQNKLSSFSHMGYPAAFTDKINPSPVSKGVKGIWYPSQIAYNAQQTCSIWVNDDWQVVVSASETSITKPVDLNNSPSGPVDSPFIRPEGVKSPPLFAIRDYANGRIAFLSQYPQFSVGQGTKWLYNREILSKGLKGIQSDFGLLLENTYRWLAEPSLKKGNLGGYVTNLARLMPENKQPEAFNGYEELTWLDDSQIMGYMGYNHAGQDKRLFRGLIGIKSSYSTGFGTVAEYAESAQKAGLDFIVFMEDFDHLTPEKLESLKSECQKYSNDKVWLYAGYTIKNNIGNYMFFFGPQVPFPPDRCLTGENNTLLNQQNQDKDGNYLNQQGYVLDWLLTACHLGANKAQVGFYNFKNSRRGMHMTDLRTYGMAALRFYDHGKLIEDVTDVYLTTALGTLPPAPASVNIVTSPDELIKEANSGNSLTYAEGKSIKTLFDESLRWTHQYDGVNVFVSNGPEIIAWPRCYRVGTFGSEEFVTGRTFMPSLISVKSDKGLKEIAIYNGDVLFRRFILNGEKKWEKMLHLEGAVQKNLILITTDIDGGKAVSFARRCWKDSGKEIAFCSDHVNDCKSYGMMLARGPASVPAIVMPSMSNDIAGNTWDGGPAGILPLITLQGNPPILDSDKGKEDGDRFNQIPILEFSDEGAVAVTSFRNEIFDDVVPSGEVINPWHGYGPKGESKLVEHNLRYREFITPTIGAPENGWAGHGVRAGANACLFRGEIRFKQDMKVKSLSLFRNWHVPIASPVILVIRSAEGIKEINLSEINEWEKFTIKKGDWFAFYSQQLSNKHIIFNRDNDLILSVTRPNGVWLYITADLEGKDVKGNDLYTYELFSINFPVDVEVKGVEQIKNMIDYVSNPTGMSIMKGQRLANDGLLDFKPDDHIVEIMFPKPKNKTNLTLPVRVQKLNPRWSVGLFQKEGYVKGDYGIGKDRYRPLGLDIYGNAYIPVYIDYAEKTHLVIGQPVIADDNGNELFIQVTHINENPQRWHVSVNNPTDKPIKTTLKKTMELPGFDFATQEISIPAGGYIVIK
ncbi:TPA: hypothetical protein ENS27_17665 [bacterium]|nr:hypothetical protein [bacterium]